MKTEKTMFYWIGWQGVAVFSWFMWGMSSFMSYWGFTMLNPNVPWWIKVTSAGLAIGINFVEFMLNRMGLDELMQVDSVSDVVLRVFGVVCYGYDIYTNIIAFILVVMAATHATSIGMAWHSDPTMTIFAIFFGLAFAIGPEPLYLKFLREKFPFPGYHYTPKYKTTYSGAPTPTNGLSPAALDYIQKKAAERNAQR